jgi:hypothetical protein
MPEHVDITDPEIHEPKGVAAASANTVYVADGAGSGAWSKVGSSQINTSSIFNTNKYMVFAEIADVSTADSTRIPCPVACTLTRVTTILGATITGADATITVTNSTGPATVGTITVANSGSAEGDIDSLTASSNNTFSAGTYVKVATDGASTNTAKLGIFLEFTRTA